MSIEWVSFVSIVNLVGLICVAIYKTRPKAVMMRSDRVVKVDKYTLTTKKSRRR